MGAEKRHLTNQAVSRAVIFRTVTIAVMACYWQIWPFPPGFNIRNYSAALEGDLNYTRVCTILSTVPFVM